MRDTPALLGGTPVFRNKVYIVRPALPKFEDLQQGVQEIIRSGMVTKGRCLADLEKALSDHLKVKHAVGVSSCTTGLMLCYNGLGLTGDVVVPSFTFMASECAIVWAGLRPVFTDVDRGTANLDPSAVESAITPDTSAIVAVHNFGNPVDIKAMQELADRRGLALIFDAAHGFGTIYQGLPVASQGHAQIFSMSPTKLLIAGEGGLVTTNDDDLAEKIRMGREYGNDGNYDSTFAGINARMAEFNALLALRHLPMLERAAQRRNEVAHLYRKELVEVPGIGFQEVREGDRNSYKDFSITVDQEAFGLTRDELALALGAENVDTRKYYDPPVHRQTAYRQFDKGCSLPNTDWLAAHSLSIPVWSVMADEIPQSIGLAIRKVHAHARAVHDWLVDQSIGEAI